MTLKHSFKTALSGLRAHRTRSGLTMLGIVIGITAIIVVMALGRAGNDLILNQVQGLGSRTLIIVPGRDTRGPSNFSSIFFDSLKDRELTALQDPVNVPTLLDLTPVVLVPSSVLYQGQTFLAETIGVSQVFPAILDLAAEEGALFGEDDIRLNERVAVIGAEVREELFGFARAVGAMVKIKGKDFRVVGVFPRKGRVGLFNIDDAVIVPYTAAQRYLAGTKHYNQFIARAVGEGDIEKTARDAELTLRELHGITDPKKDDFHVHTQADIAARVGMVTGILTALLVSVAAISLIVGGIGIMNIMLVSVTERTREIGLRKALGATNQDILMQFLLEAVILTAIGGVIGILLGALISLGASVVLSSVVGVGWVFTFPLSAAAIGIAVSAAVGLVFGIYPARQASRKSPMEALRYE